MGDGYRIESSGTMRCWLWLSLALCGCCIGFGKRGADHLRVICLNQTHGALNQLAISIDHTSLLKDALWSSEAIHVGGLAHSPPLNRYSDMTSISQYKCCMLSRFAGGWLFAA